MKGKGLAAAVMIACLLTGCVRYDGSRIGNESQLSMEYRVFNGSDQQELSLEAGDIMQAAWKEGREAFVSGCADRGRRSRCSRWKIRRVVPFLSRLKRTADISCI